MRFAFGIMVALYFAACIFAASLMLWGDAGAQVNGAALACLLAVVGILGVIKLDRDNGWRDDNTD